MWRYYGIVCVLAIVCSGCRDGEYDASYLYDDISKHLCERRVYAYGASVASIVVLVCSPKVTQIHDRLFQQRTGYVYQSSHPHAFVLMMPYTADARLDTTYRAGPWSVVLEQHERAVPAREVYQTALDPEYQYLMGKYYNRLFDVYAVVFHEEPELPCRIVVQHPEHCLMCQFTCSDSCTSL